MWKILLDAPGDRAKVHRHLRMLIARYAGVAPEELRFTIGKYGKPALDPAHHAAAIEFNVSHSGDIALIAITKARQVGIDVEMHRSNIGIDALCRGFLRLPHALETNAFYAAWTRKEAAVKARGDSIVLSRGQPVEMDGQWRIIGLPVGEEYSAALCYSGPEAEVFLWRPAG